MSIGIQPLPGRSSSDALGWSNGRMSTTKNTVFTKAQKTKASILGGSPTWGGRSIPMTLGYFDFLMLPAGCPAMKEAGLSTHAPTNIPWYTPWVRSTSFRWSPQALDFYSRPVPDNNEDTYILLTCPLWLYKETPENGPFSSMIYRCTYQK